MSVFAGLFTGSGGPLERPRRATLFPPAQVVVVALAAALLRVAFWQLARSSAFLHTPVVDGSFFDIWARTLAEGRVFQEQAFFKPPLYAWVLAFLYRLGCDLATVQVLQLGVGVVTSVLLLGVARTVLPPRQAFAAALATALLPILPFFEVQLLAEPWTLALSLAGLLPILLVIGGRAAAGWRTLGAAGLLLGVAALGRPNLLLTLAVTVGCLWWWGRGGRLAPRALLPLVIGFVVAISPATLHNLRHGEFVLVSANLGVNLWTGQSDTADGVSAIPVGVQWDDMQLRSRQAGAEKPGASSRYYTRETLGWIAAHPGRTAALLLKKAVLIGNAYPGRNNINPLWLAREDGVFLLARWWPGTWLLLPFAIVGLVFAGRGEAPWWLLKWLVLTQAAAILPFFAAVRFRQPLLPLLALFAVAGAVLLVRRAGAARLAALAVFVAAAVYVNVDWYGLGDARWLARDHFNRALIELRGYAGARPDPAAAERHFRAALELDPDDVDFNERYGALLLGQAQPLVQEIRRRAEAGSAFDELVPRADGLLRAAADRHRRATAAYPRSFRSWANLGTARMWSGDLVALQARQALARSDTTAARDLAESALAAYEDANRSLQTSLGIDGTQRELGRQMQMVAGAVLELPPLGERIPALQERVRTGQGGRR
ncbi:glycosyltransferase family 39 protein [bacterium]|nr:glycosyltransferase family 39 protein [bacterium]